MKDGILVVNKPEGMSSAGVVGRLKRLLQVKKIGHTGTLDPFATGVLLIAVGKATRISRFFLDGHKGYRARVTLGVETDTYDCTGSQSAKADPDALAKIDPETVSNVVTSFSGKQEQIPPAFSALKHKGQPLYKLARQGKMIQKPPRQIEIFHISMENYTVSSEGLPEFDVNVLCSGGTYIRSLAFDMGKKLGCGAHLSGLCRTRSSQFYIEDAVDLESIEIMERTQIEKRIVPMSQCLKFLPAIEADEATAQKIKYGQPLKVEELGPPNIKPAIENKTAFKEDEDQFRIIDQNDILLAIVRPDKTGQTYKYCCVFSG